MSITRYQTVAEGRAQADRLRPLNIIRRPASPRIICPDPSDQQMERFNKTRKGQEDHVKGLIYPSGLMIIEFRIYKSSSPWRRQAVNRAGKVLFTAIRDSAYHGYRRSWTVTRGVNGRKPLGKRYMSEREATLVITGRVKPSEARGWNY